MAKRQRAIPVYAEAKLSASRRQARQVLTPANAHLFVAGFLLLSFAGFFQRINFR